MPSPDISTSSRQASVTPETVRRSETAPRGTPTNANTGSNPPPRAQNFVEPNNRNPNSLGNKQSSSFDRIKTLAISVTGVAAGAGLYKLIAGLIKNGGVGIGGVTLTAAGITGLCSVGTAAVSGICIRSFQKQNGKLNQLEMMQNRGLKAGDLVSTEELESKNLDLDKLTKLKLLTKVEIDGKAQWQVCNLDAVKKTTKNIKKLVGAVMTATTIATAALAGFAAGGLAGFAVGGPAGAMLGAAIGVFGAYVLLDTLNDSSRQERLNDQFSQAFKAIGASQVPLRPTNNATILLSGT